MPQRRLATDGWEPELVPYRMGCTGWSGWRVGASSPYSQSRRCQAGRAVIGSWNSWTHLGQRGESRLSRVNTNTQTAREWQSRSRLARADTPAGLKEGSSEFFNRLAYYPPYPAMHAALRFPIEVHRGAGPFPTPVTREIWLSIDGGSSGSSAVQHQRIRVTMTDGCLHTSDTSHDRRTINSSARPRKNGL